MVSDYLLLPLAVGVAPISRRILEVSPTSGLLIGLTVLELDERPLLLLALDPRQLSPFHGGSLVVLHALTEGTVCLSACKVQG